ncbi:MAG: SGNH/GDSL hydrolase family protein [Mucilaginibacter sp.]|uniref:SGNH/GDSL hydrolase family protein n=1 Tax=Mucilaginibacter sp. TaxID=1882438 RepID=UPI0031A03990
MESYNYTPMPEAPVTDTLNYLALGDSYTIGESVPTQESFPYQLAGLIPGHKINTPTIIAKTGWTTDQLISAIDNSDIQNNTYDIVTLLIGVNDQYQNASQENYRIKFMQVLNTAIKFAKGDKTRVFVLSIPDYGVTPFANGKEAIIGPEIDQFNNINRKASADAGVHYIDITPISKQAADNLTLIANDGLHPSAIMYHYWVEQLKPALLNRLNKK